MAKRAASFVLNGTRQKKRPQGGAVVTVTVSGGPDTTSEPASPKIVPSPLNLFR